MGNFWSDKVPHHEKKKATPESKKKDYEFWKRQRDIKSGKIDVLAKYNTKGPAIKKTLDKHEKP